MQTEDPIPGSRIRSSLAIGTARLLLLCLLLLSMDNVTLYADDPVADVDPSTIDRAMQNPDNPPVSNGVTGPEIVNEIFDDTPNEAPDVAISALTEGGEAADSTNPAENDEVADAENIVAEPVETTDAAQSTSEGADDEAGNQLTEDASPKATSIRHEAGEFAEVADGLADTMPVAAWLKLQPPYASESPLPVSGKAMYYNPGVMERVIVNRLRFKNIEPCEECIGRVAMLRYGDINRKVWLQFYGSHVEGPYHVVDTAATQHVGMLIARDWIVDVDYQTAQRWGMRMPYVTIWESPPLDLLLANFTIPLSWVASMRPASEFSASLQSVNRAIDGRSDGYRTIKQNLRMQHRDVDSYVDLLSDVPPELYVK